MEKVPHNRRNVKLQVVVTQAEYKQLWREAALNPVGTVEGAIRVRLGFNPQVHGKNRPLVSEAQIRWEWNGKIGPMPKEK